MAMFQGDLDNNLDISGQNQLNDSRNDSHSGTTQVDPQVIFQPKIEKVLKEDIKFYELKDDNFEVGFFAQTIYSKIEKANEKNTQKIDVEVQKLLENKEDLKNQIKHILSNQIQCRNSDINCKYEGTYDEIKNHLKSCPYEFTEFNSEMVINIALPKIREQYNKSKNFGRKSSCQNPVGSGSNEQQEQSQQQYGASSRKQSTNSLYQQQQSQNSREERTLLVANFPKIGMVELFKKFGELDYFSFQKNDKNLIFFSKFSKLENAQRALDQLDQTEISGRKLRVTFFRPKSDLQKFRVFVKGLQTNDAENIKIFLQNLIGKSLSQVSLLNQYSEDRDASAFVQVFEEEDAEKLKKFGVLANTKIGKKVQFCEYRPKSNNSHQEMGGGLGVKSSSSNSGNYNNNNNQANGHHHNKYNNQNNYNNQGNNNHHHHHHHHNHNHNNHHGHHNNNRNQMRNNGHYNNNYNNDGNNYGGNHNNNNNHHGGHHNNYNNNYKNNNNNGGARNGYQPRHKGSHHNMGSKNYNNNYHQKSNYHNNNNNYMNNKNNYSNYLQKQQSQPPSMQQHQQQQQMISQFDPQFNNVMEQVKPQGNRIRVQSTSAIGGGYQSNNGNNGGLNSNNDIVKNVYPPNNRQSLEGQESRQQQQQQQGFFPLQNNGFNDDQDNLFDIFGQNQLNTPFNFASIGNSGGGSGSGNPPSTGTTSTNKQGNGFPSDQNQNVGSFGSNTQSKFQFVQGTLRQEQNQNDQNSKDIQNIVEKFQY